MEKIAFLTDTDFLDQVKSTFLNPKFIAPALAATLGAGTIGGLLASKSVRNKETPRQRRRRILRSVLVPALLAGTAAGVGGLGLSAANMKDVRFGDKDWALAEQQAIDSGLTLPVGHVTGALVGGVGTAAGGTAIGRVVNKHGDNLLNNAITKGKTGVSQVINKGIDKATANGKRLKVLEKLKGRGKKAIIAKGIAGILGGTYFGWPLGGTIQDAVWNTDYDQTENIASDSFGGPISLRVARNKLFNLFSSDE